MNEFDEKWALEFAGRRALDARPQSGEFVLLPSESREGSAWVERGISLEATLDEVLGKEHHLLLREKVHARSNETTLAAILRLADDHDRKAIAATPTTILPPSLDPSSGVVVRDGYESSDGSKRGAR